jgi:hypothetical protein
LSEDRDQDPRVVLRWPVTLLLGVVEAAATELVGCGIETVFDLSSSRLIRRERGRSRSWDAALPRHSEHGG